MVSATITVVVMVKAASKLFRAFIDGRRIVFKDGSARLGFVPDGREHVLMWFIRDKPGTTYGIDITEPLKAKMSYKAALDASGMDAGIYWFKI